jgi:hypothetical protein
MTSGTDESGWQGVVPVECSCSICFHYKAAALVGVALIAIGSDQLLGADDAFSGTCSCSILRWL